MSTSSQGPTRALGWVCTANPFYVVSAGLFLAGIWLSFGDPRLIENTWAMIVGLGGYTLLLAGTAYVLVRHMKLWDDARTVLLLCVLMFLATSVTFDEVLVLQMVDPQGGVPIRGISCYIAGFAFAVAVSAGLLRGIRLTLPAGFRVPYYLILALFFLYPLALCPFLKEPHAETLQWGLFGFSSIAGLIFLTLLPAIRRGAKYVQDNGSPWPWPLYPWSLFVLLAVAVVGRAFLLCWSLHPLLDANARVIFGPYFLAPFGFALAVLLLEMGLVSNHRGVIATALTAPVALLALACLGHRHETVYQEFLRIFIGRLGADPVYCTLLMTTAFYAYALARRVPLSVECLTATLAALTFIHRDIVNVPEVRLQPGWLIIAATTLLGLGVVRRQTWRCLLGAVGLVAALTLAFPADAPVSPYRWAIAFHLIVLILFIVGTAFDDEFARVARFLGAFLILLACVGVTLIPFRFLSDAPRWLIDLYPALMATALACYGIWRWHAPSLAVASLVFAVWALVSGWQIYRACRQLIVGLDYLVLSLVVFMLAVVVSLGKAGILSRWLATWRETAED